MTTKKKIILISSILAIVLTLSFLASAFTKPKIMIPQKIEAPENASSDFSGTMLSNYDNLELLFYQDKIVYNFEDVNLINYDYVIIDVKADLTLNDSYTIRFGPVLGSLDLDTIISSGDSYGTINVVNGLFNQYNGIFTYIFDMTSVNEGVARLHLYYNGIYYNTVSVSEVDSTILEAFKIKYDSFLESCGNNSIDFFYLYGFSDGSAEYLKQHLSNHNFNLSTCKDSLLYGK